MTNDKRNIFIFTSRIMEIFKAFFLVHKLKITPARFEGVVGVEMIMKGGVLTVGIFTSSLITGFISLLFQSNQLYLTSLVSAE